MTNKEIRRRAWTLCREKFWTILGATLFMSLLMSLCSMPTMMAAVQGNFLMIFASMLLMMVVSLILESGLLQLIANLWHDEPVSIGTLFSHASRFLKLLGIMMLMVLLMYAVMLPCMLIIALLVSIAEGLVFIGVILMFAMVIFVFYAMLRLAPVMVAYILYRDLGPWQCIKFAWRSTKGSVKRIFAHNFMLMLPLYAAIMLISLLVPAAAYTSQFANIIVSIATMLFTTLFSCYVQLGTFGLYEYLLAGGSQIRPTALPAAGDADDATL